MPQANNSFFARRGLDVFTEKNKSFIFYTHPRRKKIVFQIASGKNGYVFSSKPRDVEIVKQGIIPKKARPIFCDNFHISKIGDQSYFLTFEEEKKGKKEVKAAFSNDLLRWKEMPISSNITDSGVVLSDFQFDDQYVMFFGKKNIKIAFSRDLKDWNVSRAPVVKPRKSGFDSNVVFPAQAFLRREGIVLAYYSMTKKTGLYSLGIALLSKNQPKNLKWRSKKPLWKQADEFRKDTLYPIGMSYFKGELISYWQTGKYGDFVSLTFPQLWYKEEDEKREHPEKHAVEMRRSERNPIIEPEGGEEWEQDSTFNPTALRHEGKTHVLYRAIGKDPVSVVGCAITEDGIHIEKKYKEPVYEPRADFEGAGKPINPAMAVRYMSGGGCGGCEDARIAKIDGKYYLTYVAYDSCNPPRVAMSSIPVEDFHAHKWESWTKPVLISRPGVVDKNACILEEKVNDKYVIFHRIYPNILVDYVDSLDDFDGETVFLENQYHIPPRPLMWDSKKIGVGPTPTRTEHGWLAIYQAVGRQDPGRYKIGAMLLDLNDPTKVICRSSEPIIEPVEWYENNGHKAGVVYPCGSTVHDGNLHVYYGGADKFTCVAHAHLDTFLKKLLAANKPKLKKVRFV